MEDAKEQALRLAEKSDVYYGVGLRGERLKSGRGEAKDVACIPGFWVDVDIAGDAHKQKDLPEDLDAAIELLDSFPLQPSILVHSGYGLHAYWLFYEPWEMDGEEGRSEAENMLSRFQATLRGMAQQKGWKLDNTADLPRVLRVPGTLNHKSGTPKEVKILRHNESRYDPGDFEQYLLQDEELSYAFEKTEDLNIPAGDVSLIINRCKFIQYCRDKAAKIIEPEWYAMITNMARAENGPAKVHEFSKPYPGYSERETDEKIQHALRDGHPHTCAYIKTELGFADCPKDGCNVTAPIALAISRTSRAKHYIENIGDRFTDEVFTPEVIGALAILKKNDPTYYAGLKQTLRGKANLNDLERAVNHQIAENQNLRLVQADEAPMKLDDIMPGVPLKEIRIPYEWSFNENGIWQQKKTKEGLIDTVCACPVPVILTKRLRNIDTGEEKVELSFFRDKKWNNVIANRSSIFTRQGLVQVADRGLPVSSETAKHLISFLDGLERSNLNILPLKKSVSRMGWVDGLRQFLPGMADIEIDIDDRSSMMNIINGYRGKGTVDRWVDVVAGKSREYPVARFFLSAAFAAPLLKVLGERSFVLHSYGPSKGGKTAALKAAMSVWGCPNDIMANFNATKVGLERLAGFFCDLPMGVDERQVMGDKQSFVESLVYLIGEGQGKVRGAKGGGLQQTLRWNTIALTTGEQPLTLGSTREGAKTRALELYGKPITNEGVARALHGDAQRYYGTAGPEFMKRLIAYLPEHGKEFVKQYEMLLETLIEEHPDNVSAHLAYVAIIAMADIYSSIWVFGMDEEEAGEQASSLADAIIGQLETQSEADEANRAYEYIISWYRMNEAFFNDTDKKKYGITDEINRIIYIYPPAFEEAMEAGGFISVRVLRDWHKQGLLMVEKRKGEETVRFRIRKWNTDTKDTDYFVAVRMPEQEEYG